MKRNTVLLIVVALILSVVGIPVTAQPTSPPQMRFESESRQAESSTQHAPQAEPGWLRVLGTTLVTDQAEDITLGVAEASVYITGHTDGDLDGHTNSGASDIFVAKYDRLGNKKWTLLAGTSASDYGTGIATGPGGALYVTGYTQGDLNGESNTAPSWDAFLSRYDGDGNHKWTRLLGVEAHAQPPIYSAKVAVDGGGNPCLIASAGSPPYMVVAKYNSSGVRQWLHNLADQAWGGSGDVTADSSGNVYVTGWTEGDLDGDTNAGWWDIVVAKYDSGGTRQWAHLQGTSGQDYGLGIALDPSGTALYVTGYTPGDLDGQNNTGKDDVFLTKYDSAGGRLWTRLLGTSEEDHGHDVTVAANGRIYVTGQSFGSLDGQHHAGEYDVFVSQYNSAGARQWTVLNGTVENDKGRGVTVDSGGYTYVAGLSEGDWDGAILKGDYDAFAWKVGEIETRTIIENFDDGQAVAWQDDGSGRWAVAMIPSQLASPIATNGVYQMEGDMGLQARTSHYQGSFSKLTYQADMRKTAGDSAQYNNAYGLRFFSDVGGDNFYGFYISRAGWYWIGKRVDGGYSTLVDWTESSALRTGFNTWNTLKVQAQDGQLGFYANDTLLHNLQDM